MIHRDIEISEYENEKRKLIAEIMMLQKSNNAYKEQHERDIKEINELKGLKKPNKELLN